MTIELNLIDTILVPHKAFDYATKRIEQCYKTAETAFEPICLPLIGESRTGKTRALKNIEQKYPSNRLSSGLNIPILRVKVPSKPTVKGLLEVLLHAVEDPLYKKDTEVVKTLRLLTLIKHTQTRLIMLDDLQHFYDRGSNKVLHHLADWLKNFMDESKVGFILSGLPTIESVLNQNEQLAGRSSAPVKMPRFDWLVDRDRNEFVAILEAFQIGMCELEMPIFISEEMAFRFYCACGGLVGYLTKILRKAVEDAYFEERNHITLAHLSDAFDAAVWTKEQSYCKIVNPFTKSFSSKNSQELLNSVRNIGSLTPDEADDVSVNKVRSVRRMSVQEAFAR